MLTAADLEVNVLQFRQRAFQFERLAELPDGTWAVFRRTETENERQLRPRLVQLTVVVPLSWVVLDESEDLLRVARSDAAVPAGDSTPVEVAAEPAGFEEGGRRWARRLLGATGYLYAPAEQIAGLLQAPRRESLGLVGPA